MPHVKGFKSGQRVVLRELRGWLGKDGLCVGDTGTVRLVNGELGVEFDRITYWISGVYVRYAPGIESLIVDCCDALESVPECPQNGQNANPWEAFWKAAEMRRNALFFAESRPFMLTNDGIQILLLLDYWTEKEICQ